jgi:hypothetical protein
MNQFAAPWIRFDAWLIHCLEKLCHKAQRLTGHSHYVWIRVLIALYGIGCLVMPFVFGTLSRFDAVICILTGIFSLFVSSKIPALEKRALERIDNKLANPRKQEWLSRLLFAGLTLLYLGRSLFSEFVTNAVVTGDEWFVVFLLGIANLALYLFACDLLPRQRSKIGEWIESLFLKPIPTKDSDH